MIGGLLKLLKNIVDPNHWAEQIGNKTGLYDKAEKSSFRQWALNLKGWKWWLYQIVGGIIFVIIIEYLLNLVGMTMLPWR